MAEPTVSTAGIVLVTVTLTGSIFGMQYDALFAGFACGVVALSYLPTMSRAKAAGSVFGSSVLAGYFAPVVAAAAHNFFPWLAPVGDFVRVAAAAAIGFGWQALLPAGISRLRGFIEKKEVSK